MRHGIKEPESHRRPGHPGSVHQPTRRGTPFVYLEHLIGLIREQPGLKGMSTGHADVSNDDGSLGKVRNRNLQRNQVVDGQSLYAEKLAKFSAGMAACFGCPVHCRHRYRSRKARQGQLGRRAGVDHAGRLGSEPDCRRMEAVLVGNYLVNRYGIDSLEFGSMLSWAIELYEKGIIDETTTDGMKLEWGNETTDVRDGTAGGHPAGVRRHTG